MNENKNITQKSIEKIKIASDLATDYALAKALKIPQSSVSRYTNGVNNISLEKLETMANELDLKISINFNKKQ